MQLSLKLSTAIAALATLAAPAILFGGAASAQPVQFNSSYVGAGVTSSITNGGQNEDAANFGGNVQGRFAVPQAPVSVRGAVLFSGRNAAIVPTITYDQRLTDKANAYVGAGYSFIDKEGKASPLGNRDSFVVTAGAEAAVAKDVVVYGDAKWGLNAYQNSPADALSLQAGVGYRF